MRRIDYLDLVGSSVATLVRLVSSGVVWSALPGGAGGDNRRAAVFVSVSQGERAPRLRSSR